MRVAITETLLKSLKPKPKPFDVWDSKLPGLIVRVRPGGLQTYYAQLTRGKRLMIGRADVLTPTQARDQAREHMADFARGEDPTAERRKGKDLTLREFIQDRYKDYVQAHHRQPAETLRKIGIYFDAIGDTTLAEITAWAIEKHRSGRLKSGTTAATTNRELAVLKSALNHAVSWGLLGSNPISGVKALKEDRSATIRYLKPDEDSRLREAISKREAERHQRRENFRRWRADRGYKVPPAFGAFTDHLKPLVLLALNTGLRRGELFDLRWADINFAGNILTVTGKTAKSGSTRHVPLNDEAFDVLRGWREQSKDGRVFPSLDGERLNNIKKAWSALLKKAKITGFRFHDCRHDFASKLVMAGVDLNTVRELLGHSDIKMTLRYAHLAPEHKAAAVQKLIIRR